MSGGDRGNVCVCVRLRVCLFLRLCIYCIHTRMGVHIVPVKVQQDISFEIGRHVTLVEEMMVVVASLQ